MQKSAPRRDAHNELSLGARQQLDQDDHSRHDGRVVPDARDDHTLIVTFPLADRRFGRKRERRRFLRMASRIDRVLTERGLGTIDGDGFGDGTAELFIHGSDADAMLDGLEPVIRSFRLPPGATAVLLYGSAEDSRSRTVPLAGR